MDSVRDALGKWGKRAADATKKAENLAGNMWQHLKTSPNVVDAAVAKIAQGTKVLAEGGYEKVFHQTFQTTSEERLQKSYACYLSTSAGPIMGTLYLSTVKLAFCSDNPLPCQVGEKTEWSHYKVKLIAELLLGSLSGLHIVNCSYLQTASVRKMFLAREALARCIKVSYQIIQRLQ